MTTLKNSSLIIFSLVIFLGCGCEADTTVDKKQKQNTPNFVKISEATSAVKPGQKSISTVPKITFIELGSVTCIPCRKMEPIIEEIENEYKDRVEVVFYDVKSEEGKPYAKKYGIQVIPTQIFLDENGNEFHRHRGYYPKEEIEKVLRSQGIEK
ncbi:MAG: TlpA family protein disulfide reductase [Elusimicrobiota bacterium]